MDGGARGTSRLDWHGNRCTAAYGNLPSPGVPVYRMSKTSGVGEPEGYPVEDSVMWPRPGCLLQFPSVIQWELFPQRWDGPAQLWCLETHLPPWPSQTAI